MTRRPFTRAFRHWAAYLHDRRVWREFTRPVSVGWLEQHSAREVVRTPF